MRIVIIYTTNSGATYLVAEEIARLLKPHHTAALVRAEDATATTITENDLIIMGSPSWDSPTKEGSPTPPMLNLLKRLSTIDLNNKPCAVFGCGDRSYTHFCGAVDDLELFVQNHHGQLCVPPLKIDHYFGKEHEAKDAIMQWIGPIATYLMQSKIHPGNT
jgi:flavodoxin